MRVRTKVNIIYFVIILFLLGIGAIVTIALLDENNYNAKKEKTSETTTKEVPATETTKHSVLSTQGTSVSKETTTTTTSTSKNGNVEKTTKTTGSTRITTKKQTTTETTTARREVTVKDADFPDVLNKETWEILRLINEERRKNGLTNLEVAVDLREKALEAAETWYEENETAAKEVLRGYSNYRRKSNQLAVSEAAQNLFSHTKENTGITTNRNIHYVGIGLLNKPKGVSGLPTVYYCIIYE